MKRTDGPFLVYEIIPGLLYQRGKLHRLSPTVKDAGLRYFGIEQVVALAPTTPDPHWFGQPFYHHLPIPDGACQLQDVLLDLAAMLAGTPTMTLCNAGRNRSGMLSALIVRELTGIPGIAAIDVVRQHRPNALANDRFTSWLSTLS